MFLKLLYITYTYVINVERVLIQSWQPGRFVKNLRHFLPWKYPLTFVKTIFHTDFTTGDFNAIEQWSDPCSPLPQPPHNPVSSSLELCERFLLYPPRGTLSPLVADFEFIKWSLNKETCKRSLFSLTTCINFMICHWRCTTLRFLTIHLFYLVLHF